MSRRRSLSLPWFVNSATQPQEDYGNMSNTSSPYHSGAVHSRNSSGASNASSPSTPTSSSRSHNRCPSSNSSIATSPDSPVNVVKSSLHDLVEDPAEREDTFFYPSASSANEPLCICDTTFCEHRQSVPVSHSALALPSTPEWLPDDDAAFSDSALPGDRSSKRRRSIEHPNESLTSRLSRRWPSISHRWRENKPATSLVSGHTVRSAPPSRSSSIRLPPLRRSVVARAEPAHPTTPPFTPVDSQLEEVLLSRPRAISRPQKPVDIMIPEPTEDPFDRQELSSTPLLPPMMRGHLSHSNEALQSPLQSPTVAEVGGNGSAYGTPNLTPVAAGMPTPPLSSKPSVASFTPMRSAHLLRPSSEIPPMAISEQMDHWADRLGHANFHIQPEPYMPDHCSLQSCKRLLDDWESARVDYMRVAARISEHYGPTSQTFKFTEQKWAEIDDKWRAYHEKANAEAGASSDVTLYQPLAETQPLSKMPSLNDPEQPSKFPSIDEADIVGPMVQYAKIQRQPTRKPALLRIFTDPTSLLGSLRR